MRPSFVHPIEPFRLSQSWGTFDPANYAQFGFTRHNGLDMVLAPDKRIVSPCNGTVVRVATKENGLWQPKGGGIYIGIVSEPMDFPAFTNVTPEGLSVPFMPGTYRVLIDLLHLESISTLVKEGDEVTSGQVIAIGDNTGFSTGPHCHSQWRRIDWYGGANYGTIDINDANDSFDPSQFFVGAGPSRFFFNKDLYLGMTDQDVRMLQKRLNENPATQVATTGNGSPGNETMYFGTRTLEAVKKYQTLNNIKPVLGYCGKLTRAVLNQV